MAASQVQFPLSRERSLFGTQAPRDALFQNLNREGGCGLRWFAEEQVDMLRHDNIADQGEAVQVAHFIQNLDKDISSANRAQERQAPIASERDEM